MDIAKIPLSVYVHWPWCVQKCPYCDFNSFRQKGKDRAVTRHYLQALIQEIHSFSRWDAKRPIQSIFIGGGTPSLMTASQLEKLLNALQKSLVLASDVEITLEANPGTLDEERFASFAQLGVNRLSLGIQSLDDRFLKTLGRIHNRADALRAIERVRTLFPEWNLDLMFGLPGQTWDDLRRDVRRISQMGSTHLSCYQLTIEEGTYFAKVEPEGIPGDDVLAQYQARVVELLSHAGYQRYEVSAYAKPGSQCRHNRNYWEYGDYLALGAGAHGKMTRRDGIYRKANEKNPLRYIRQMQKEGRACRFWQVQADEIPFEFMLNALRLRDGVPQAYWEERTGLPWRKISPTITRLQQNGLLQENSDRIVTTEKGYLFLSDVQEEFL